MWSYWFPFLKGEIGAKNNILSKEREQSSEQNGVKLWKSDEMNGSYDIFKYPLRHFLTSPYEYSNGYNDDVMPSQFCKRFNYRK